MCSFTVPSGCTRRFVVKCIFVGTTAMARGPGDVRDSLADISAARKAFGFEPAVTMDEALPEYIRWARAEVAS